MSSRWFRLLALACVVGLPPAHLAAQDEKPAEAPAAEAKEDAEAAPQSYAELRQRFDALNEQAQKLIDESRTAAAERKTAIRKEFQELLTEHAQVVEQLTDAAKKEYLADPKKNTEAGQLLADLAADLLRRDRYEAARELVQPLIDNKADIPGIHATAGAAAFSMDDFAAAEKHLTQAQEQGPLDRQAAQFSSIIEEEQEKWQREKELRAKEAQADDLPRVKLTTTKGEIVIELFENEAPNTVANFISLVEKGFYNGLGFHRVLGGFMAQGGDPSGDGSGGPGYTIECECAEPDARMHFRGTLSMAHAGKDTGGSQFFLTFRPTPHLDGKHTAFGRVVEGMDVLAKLTRRDPSGFGRLPEPDKIVKAEVVRKRDHEYQPKTTPE